MFNNILKVIYFSLDSIEYKSLYIFILNILGSKELYLNDSLFLDILNDRGTNSNYKLLVSIHKVFNLLFKISFILKITPK